MIIGRRTLVIPRRRSRRDLRLEFARVLETLLAEALARGEYARAATVVAVLERQLRILAGREALENSRENRAEKT